MSDFAKHYVGTVEAARLLGVRPATLRSWRCDRKEPVPSIKVGSAVLYPLSGLHAYLARHH